MNKLEGTKKRFNFTQEQKNAILSIAINPKNIVEFGSWTYIHQPYFADMDLFEEVVVCCSKNKLGEYMAKKLQEIVMSLPNIYIFSELKAGLDERYNINIGSYVDYKIIGFNEKKVKLDLLKLFQEELLTKKDYMHLKKLSTSPLTKTKWDELFKLLRDKYIIRWEKKEIINGYKILEGNKKISLIEALEGFAPIKIDIIGIIDCNYTEITNFFILKYKTSKKGKEIISNLPSNYFKTIGFTLLGEVDKLLFNKQYYNPFKAIKRMYSFARLSKNQVIQNKLINFLRSNTSLVYQIIGNIDALLIVISDTQSNEESFKKAKPPPFGTISIKEIQKIRKTFIEIRFSNILKEIDNFRLRLSIVTEFKIPDEVYFIINKIIKKKGIGDFHSIIKNLYRIRDILQKIINHNAIIFLQKINFYPKLPHDLLLTNKKNYSRSYPVKKGIFKATTYDKLEPSYVEKIIYPK